MSLTSSIPVSRVSDYAKAPTFWHDVLGFDVMQEADAPDIGFGIFRKGRVQVFLLAWDGPGAACDAWRAYFHTDDLDALGADLSRKGCAFTGPISKEYGMDEIELADPDGNVICFGQDSL